ncbi:MAG: hypothetical protein MI924_30100, partial [Chloroflexales bacterium]|nr:hypothetical protein [Chloroflexales bacterium]
AVLLFERAIRTAAGEGVLFTVIRDTPPDQDLTWYEQHAVIPRGDRFLVMWLKAPNAATHGAPVPAMAQMLDGLQWDAVAPIRVALTPSASSPVSIADLESATAWTTYHADSAGYTLPVPTT